MFPTIGPRLCQIMRMKSMAKALGRAPTVCLLAPEIVDEVACELAMLNQYHPKLYKLGAAGFALRLRTPERVKFDGLGLVVGLVNPWVKPGPEGPVVMQLVQERELIEPRPAA